MNTQKETLSYNEDREQAANDETIYANTANNYTEEHDLESSNSKKTAMKFDKAKNEILDLIRKHDVFYDYRRDILYTYGGLGHYEACDTAGFKNNNPTLKAYIEHPKLPNETVYGWNIFLNELKKLGRHVSNIVGEDPNWTTRPISRHTDETEFNVFARMRDTFVSKVRCERPNESLITLFTSVSGGNERAFDYLCHLFAYKYLNPAASALPVTLIYPATRIGKDVMISHFAQAAFGKCRASSEDYRSLMSEFNDTEIGLLFHAYTEMKSNESITDTIKVMSGAAQLRVNPKGKPAYMTKNMKALFIFSNDETRAIQLDNMNSDDRYSVIRVQEGKRLADWISERQGSEYVSENGKQPSEKFMREITDPVEVGKFMYWIIHVRPTQGISAGEAPRYNPNVVPAPLRGAGYETLLRDQERVYISFAERYLREDFKIAVEMNHLYLLYKQFVNEYDAPRFLKTSDEFTKRVRAWLSSATARNEFHYLVMKKCNAVVTTNGYSRTNSKKCQRNFIIDTRLMKKDVPTIIVDEHYNTLESPEAKLSVTTIRGNYNEFVESFLGISKGKLFNGETDESNVVSISSVIEHSATSPEEHVNDEINKYSKLKV